MCLAKRFEDLFGNILVRCIIGTDRKIDVHGLNFLVKAYPCYLHVLTLIHSIIDYPFIYHINFYGTHLNITYCIYSLFFKPQTLLQ